MLAVFLTGCPHNWDSVNPHGADGGDAMTSEAANDVANDVAPDAVDTVDTGTDAADVPLDVATDATDATDAVDVQTDVPMDVPMDVFMCMADVSIAVPPDTLQFDAPDTAMATDVVDASDAGDAADATCVTCGDAACVDTQTDPNNCGLCGIRCTGANESGACVAGSCACSPGFVRYFGCRSPTPRLIAPISTALTMSRTPTLHWTNGANNDAFDTTDVAVCPDPMCAGGMQAAARNVTGTSWTVTPRLSAGVHFWHATTTAPGGAPGTPSAPWEFFVAGDSPGDGVWGFVPDVNGDGLADVIVGSPDSASGGSAIVYRNNGTGYTPMAPLTPMATAPGLEFGISVAATGDLDGDGFGDFAVGQSCAVLDASCSAGASVTVYFGGGMGIVTGPRIVDPSGMPSMFGRTIAAAGDVNGDGFGDLLVGDMSAQNNTGRATIMFGLPGGFRVAIGNPLLTYPLMGLQLGGLFGASLAGGGDLNGDGYSEILIGAPNDLTTLPGGGDVYAIQAVAAANPATNVTIVARGTLQDEHVGQSIAWAGDTNHDGLEDIIVGAPGAPCGGTAQIIAGDPVWGNGTVLGTIGGSSATGSMGAVVSGVGDFNGDGLDDVAASDPTNNLVEIMGLATMGMGFTTPHNGAVANFGVSLAPSVDAMGHPLLLVGNGGSTSIELIPAGTGMPTMLAAPTGAGPGFGSAVAVSPTVTVRRVRRCAAGRAASN